MRIPHASNPFDRSYTHGARSPGGRQARDRGGTGDGTQSADEHSIAFDSCPAIGLSLPRDGDGKWGWTTKGDRGVRMRRSAQSRSIGKGVTLAYRVGRSVPVRRGACRSAVGCIPSCLASDKRSAGYDRALIFPSSSHNSKPSQGTVIGAGAGASSRSRPWTTGSPHRALDRPRLRSLAASSSPSSRPPAPSASPATSPPPPTWPSRSPTASLPRRPVGGVTAWTPRARPAVADRAVAGSKGRRRRSDRPSDASRGAIAASRSNPVRRTR